MKRRPFAILLTVSLALILAGCGGSTATKTPPSTANQKPVNGGTITVSSFASPASINPISEQDVPGFDIDSLMYDALVVPGPKDLKPQPDLATRWKVSPDGKTYTFWLNPKAKWSDGTPVTAQDVIWTYEQYANPKNASPSQSYYAPIKKFIKVNAHEVQFVLKQPFGPFMLSSATGFILPYHVLKGLTPGKALQQATQLTKTPIVGSGPFILTKIAPGNYYEFKANTHYFLGAPHIKKLIYKIVPDQNSGVAQLKTGSVDYATVPPQDAATIRHSAGVTMLTYPQMDYNYIGYNLKNPIFKNPLTRLALTYAINRKQILKSVVDGYGQVANGIVPPISWAYDPNLKPMAYSPSTAKELLKQAGWTMGKNGVLVNKQGKPFAFTLITNSGNPVRAQIGTIVAQELRQVGVKCTFQTMAFRAFVNSALIPGKFDAFILGWQLTADPDQSSIFLSAMTPPNGQNFTSYSDKTVDKAIQTELNSASQSVRQKAMFTIQEQMQKDPPYTFLYFPKDIVGLSSHFKGFTPNPAMDFYQPYKWWLQPASK